MTRRKLGKGLSAIISSSSSSSSPVQEIENNIADYSDRIVSVPLKQIRPNPDQPRTHFNDISIDELSESIQSVGLIQPIILRREDPWYYIIAGERRFRAVEKAGLSNIKAIIMEASEEENLTLALIENVQRENLDPIEEAKAYKTLSTRFKLKQQDIARRVGKDRTTVANLIRLLTLPESIQEGLSSGLVSTGHAKLLLSANDDEARLYFYEQIQSRGLSVRALEKFIIDYEENKGKQEKIAAKKDAHVREMEERLVSMLGTKVEIRHSGTRGKIEISYYSLEDFERIVDRLS